MVQVADAKNEQLERASEDAAKAALDPTGEPATRRQPSPRLHRLPRDLADFTGREREMARIVAALSGARSDTGLAGASVRPPDGSACAIVGMGGIGKTALAIHAAHQPVDEYPGGQIVVDLRRTSVHHLHPAGAMGQVVHALQPNALLPADEEQLAAVHRSTLAGCRALLLLDNARDSAQVQSLVPPDPSGLLVTSRHGLALPGLQQVDMDTLSPEEADDLLAQIVGRGRASGDELEEIAALSRRLPLALRVAGDFLETHPDWQIEAFIDTLRDERKRQGSAETRGP